MGRKVCVLMSTYNGEKYLKEQIDSILNQIEVEIYLLIRDDGSKDSTVEILDKYNKLENVTVIKGENLGAKKSFLTLISMAPDYFDYYALSDQDDYWLEDKMISAISHIEGEVKSLEDNFLYYSNTCLVDKDLFPLNEIGFNVDRPYSFGEILIRNCASGCTYVFGKKLKGLIKAPQDLKLENIPMHDHWINMICLATGGKIIFEKKSHILYRQHGGNVIGNKRTLFVKIRNSSLIIKNDKRYNYCFQLFLKYKENLGKREKRVLKRVIDYKDSFKDTVRLAFDREIKPRDFLQKIVVTLSVLRRSF